MIKFVKHGSNDYPEKEEYKTLEELLEAQKEYLYDGEVFATNEDGECLMKSSTQLRRWFVLGRVYNINLKDRLPKYDEVFSKNGLMKIYAVMNLSKHVDTIRGLFLNKENAEKYAKKLELNDVDDKYLNLVVSEFRVLDV